MASSKVQAISFTAADVRVLREVHEALGALLTVIEAGRERWRRQQAKYRAQAARALSVV